MIIPIGRYDVMDEMFMLVSKRIKINSAQTKGVQVIA